MKETIVQVGAPVLRQTARAIAKKDIGSRSLNLLITKMSKALANEEYGVAIAAPQVGSSLRMFIVAGHVFKEGGEEDTRSKKDEPNRIYINPEITRMSKKKREMAEGCLSVRGQYGTVMRHEKVTLKALDEKGKPVLQHASGLLAHIFQHECDHLEGILYIDKAARLTDDSERVHLREEFPA
ncbi:MAG TPA: peptide deformylase [Candidatus Paceibacterota bacterium]|nr:peptide deformylase [Candidatus Paceibacterota bacterium]